VRERESLQKANSTWPWWTIDRDGEGHASKRESLPKRCVCVGCHAHSDNANGLLCFYRHVESLSACRVLWWHYAKASGSTCIHVFLENHAWQFCFCGSYGLCRGLNILRSWYHRWWRLCHVCLRCDMCATGVEVKRKGVTGTINLARMDNYDESKCLDGSLASCYHRAGKDGNDDCIACVVCLWIWIWIYWESMCVLKEQSGKVFPHSWGSNRHIFAMRKVKRLLCVGIIHSKREKCLWHMKPECLILCVKSDDTMCCS